MHFDEADGSLTWQLVAPKLAEDVYLDWPQAGMCSPATIEGDRVYMVTNRAEVVCLDLHGLHNGNGGPFLDEGRYMAPDGPYLYVNTSNGLTSKHDGVDRPEAPSLVAIDKMTGKMVARERKGISERIFHCTWSSPALGEVDGRRLIFFAGGNSVIYGFEALRPGGTPAARQLVDFTAAGRAPRADDGVPSLRCVWRFDCDPAAPKDDIHRYIRNRQVSPSTIKSMPVFHNDRLYVTVGGDIWGNRSADARCGQNHPTRSRRCRHPLRARAGAGILRASVPKGRAKASPGWNRREWCERGA